MPLPGNEARFSYAQAIIWYGVYRPFSQRLVSMALCHILRSNTKGSG